MIENGIMSDIATEDVIEDDEVLFDLDDDEVDDDERITETEIEEVLEE